jgi:hypothetical protein
MADNPDTSPNKGGVVSISDTAHAPFIFYDWAPTFGFMNGIVSITLAANRSTVGPEGLINDQVVVAHLRGNIQAALSLRKALDDALLMAAPTREGKAN